MTSAGFALTLTNKQIFEKIKKTLDKRRGCDIMAAGRVMICTM